MAMLALFLALDPHFYRQKGTFKNGAGKEPNLTVPFLTLKTSV